MLYITVDCGEVQEDWDLKIYNRLINSIRHLEKEGFTVERYDKFSEQRTQKRIITITRANISENPLEI